MSKIFPPWTAEEVAALNQWQRRDDRHPFTCGNGGHAHGVLVATPEGWMCSMCDYVQSWAHDFMATAWGTPA